MRADDQGSLPAHPHSDDSITKTRDAIAAFQVEPDLRLGIDRDFFSTMKEHSQIQNDRLPQLSLFATTDLDIADFDPFGHDPRSEYIENHSTAALKRDCLSGG